jgi:hypothetical protein
LKYHIPPSKIGDLSIGESGVAFNRALAKLEAYAELGAFEPDHGGQLV